MRIALFLNHFVFPDHSATTQLLVELDFDLAAEWQRVVVIASRQRYDAPQERLPTREWIGGVEV
ncbi:hypothetical protein [Prosthecomicrobium pneumaticum]|uniref:Uncharacterized protein n=1 Tax=Prosthecomicrobium pneumaticum TaxID=81895 RepID=A0A7W9CV07_9HYPH|nr:hypothetical protein [Prosthecomicrobium pneumaticum]MBB5751862.1 hypothetical protein [Prosthecomicrobium pneumaticum]